MNHIQSITAQPAKSILIRGGAIVAFILVGFVFITSCGERRQEEEGTRNTISREETSKATEETHSIATPPTPQEIREKPRSDGHEELPIEEYDAGESTDVASDGETDEVLDTEYKSRPRWQETDTVDEASRAHVTSRCNMLVYPFAEKQGYRKGELLLYISVASQMMYVIEGGVVIGAYPVSTAKAGVGSASGSNKTPLGLHKIAGKVGDGEPVGRVFRGRRATSEISPIYTDETDVPDDPVVTRMMVLSGLEEGKNKGRNSEGVLVDSNRRSIYIHGTHEEGLLLAKKPMSHGCIRMLNDDVLELYRNAPSGTYVYIDAQ